MATVSIPGTFNSRAVDDRGVLYRSANLDELDDAGIAALRALGVGLVIDLREPHERGSARHGIPTAHIPIYGDGNTPTIGTLEGVYERLLAERADALVQAVAAIADAETPVLVHCKIGKDRTAIVIALAMLAAGHPRETVIADYVRSSAPIAAVRGEETKARFAGLGLSDETYDQTVRLHLAAPADAIAHAIDIIDAEGGAIAYLERASLPAASQLALVRRLGPAT